MFPKIQEILPYHVVVYSISVLFFIQNQGLFTMFSAIIRSDILILLQDLVLKILKKTLYLVIECFKSSNVC